MNTSSVQLWIPHVEVNLILRKLALSNKNRLCKVTIIYIQLYFCMTEYSKNTSMLLCLQYVYNCANHSIIGNQLFMLPINYY